MPCPKKYDERTDMRLTDCCGATSTYHDTELCCKVCWQTVDIGEGDGNEFRRRDGGWTYQESCEAGAHEDVCQPPQGSAYDEEFDGPFGTENGDPIYLW